MLFRSLRELDSIRNFIEVIIPSKKVFKFAQFIESLSKIATKRNVKVRVISDELLCKARLNDPKTFFSILPSQFKGVNLRCLPEIPLTELVIYDHRSLMLSTFKTDSPDKMTWLYSSNQAMVLVAIGHFENLWCQTKESKLWQEAAVENF